MRFFCIADPDSSLGFRLVGVETRTAKTRAEALEALREALSRQVGIILVTETVTELIGPEVKNLLYQEDFPLVLEIPSRGKKKQRPTVNEFLKEMLGVKM
ncbi:MAG: V-type ATP synthase subunit F [Candidatus Omnitrophica bacterium]|nr:V-type ATP synthase subunit F [Candidatus Omnitrophota bacterium]